MLAEPLTPDNPHYHASPRSVCQSQSEHFAVNCTNISFLTGRDGSGPIASSADVEAVRDLVEHSLAENTRTAYLSDLRHYTGWGGTLPATPAMIATYIAAHADILAVATIARRVATLSKAHDALDANPCLSALVKATLQGLRRRRGTAQQQAKPLLRDDLMLVLDRLGTTAKDSRDRALLLIGFSGGFAAPSWSASTEPTSSTPAKA